MTVAIFLFLFYLCHVIDEGGWGLEKRETGLKKKKLPGLLTGKGEKQKGDETQLHGKDVCVCVCVCVCTRLSALPSARRREAPGAGPEHPPT